MRRLSGGIPRGFADGRSHDARVYRAYVLSIVNKLFGAGVTVPAHVAPTLREAGRCVTELERLAAALDDALRRKRRREASRYRRQLVTLRTQLWTAERRLEEQAATLKPRSFRDAARLAGGQS